jgi:hypothetical protein
MVDQEASENAEHVSYFSFLSVPSGVKTNMLRMKAEYS